METLCGLRDWIGDIHSYSSLQLCKKVMFVREPNIVKKNCPNNLCEKILKIKGYMGQYALKIKNGQNLKCVLFEIRVGRGGLRISGFSQNASVEPK